MTKFFLPNVSDLIENQRGSYFKFLIRGVTEELNLLANPLITTANLPTRRKKEKTLIQLYFFTEKVKYQLPSVKIKDFLIQDQTYSIKVYVKTQYSYPFNKAIDTHENKTKNIKAISVYQDLFLGEIPLITEDGTFIINGYERVVVCQIIRSPGIYFKKEYQNTINKKKLTYTATLISDKGLWTKFILEPDLKNLEKDTIEVKLSDTQTINNLSEQKCVSVFSILKYFGIHKKEIEDSLKNSEFLRTIVEKGVNALEDLETTQILNNSLYNLNTGCFSIGKLGRYKLNKSFNLNIPLKVTYLTAIDIIKIIDGLFELKYLDKLNDDIDHLKNKQIRTVGDLLQLQLRSGLHKIQKKLMEEDSEHLNLEEEELNSEVTRNLDFDFRIITNSIQDFFMGSELSQFMDQINPLAEIVHKRKISVFGPNGLNRDRVSLKIRDIHPSQYGRLCFIETPEGSNAGLISSLATFGRISEFGFIETPYFIIKNSRINTEKDSLFLNPEEESKITVALDSFGETEQKEFSYIKKDTDFLLKPKTEGCVSTVTPLQLVSISTSLIPFVEHNDANRALMGANMQRQAVPILLPQKPIVGTGFESIISLDSDTTVKSSIEGKITYVSSNNLIIKNLKNQSFCYLLNKHKKSNQQTWINQRPNIWPSEHVFSGQIIGDNSSSLDGELALGQNLTVAYMPWEGYNYEDAVIISDRLVSENCLTSIHLEEFETSIYDENKLRFSEFLKEESAKNLDSNGIVKIGTYVKQNDILVAKIEVLDDKNNGYNRLAQMLFHPNKPFIKDLSLRVPQGVEGRILDIKIVTINNSKKQKASQANSEVKILLASIQKIQIGDKLSGRHGNKGIISKILPQQEMPFLPDGTPIDILFNPLGVPSRMNVGQIFECLLGFAGSFLGNRFKIVPFDEVYGFEASRVLINQSLKAAALSSNMDWIYSKTHPGKILIRDGRTGEYFDNPITIGKPYILKLIHLVENKIHARSTGPYSAMTEQPLAGKSQHGGQRFGEMEVWALEAYGASYTLQELLTIKSDDIDGRADIYKTLLVNEQPKPSIPEGFLTLIRELNALGIDFQLHKHIFDETQEKNIFLDIENRLKIRALLSK